MRNINTNRFFQCLNIVIAFNFAITWAPHARDNNSEVPTVTADAHHAPTLPENSDRYTLHYQATHFDAVEDLARIARSFTPATSQIFPLQNGVLQITDTATSLKKVYLIIKKNDVKPTPEMKRKWRKLVKEEDERRQTH